MEHTQTLATRFFKVFGYHGQATLPYISHFGPSFQVQDLHLPRLRLSNPSSPTDDPIQAANPTNSQARNKSKPIQPYPIQPTQLITSQAFQPTSRSPCLGSCWHSLQQRCGEATSCPSPKCGWWLMVLDQESFAGTSLYRRGRRSLRKSPGGANGGVFLPLFLVFISPPRGSVCSRRTSVVLCQKYIYIYIYIFYTHTYIY